MATVFKAAAIHCAVVNVDYAQKQIDHTKQFQCQSCETPWPRKEICMASLVEMNTGQSELTDAYLASVGLANNTF